MDDATSTLPPQLTDEEGRVLRWPSKRNRASLRPLVLEYLAQKFEQGKKYKEREVNAVLREWHVFDDPALLRRELVDRGYFARETDGSFYWRTSSL